MIFFFFKQKTAYEMRISDWSSDVCSSDLTADTDHNRADGGPPHPVNRKAMKTILYPVKQRGQERGLKPRENADANGGKQRPVTRWRGDVKGTERPPSAPQRPPRQRPQPAHHHAPAQATDPFEHHKPNTTQQPHPEP